MILILKPVSSLLVAEKSYVKIVCATLGALRRSPRVKGKFLETICKDLYYTGLV